MRNCAYEKDAVMTMDTEDDLCNFDNVLCGMGYPIHYRRNLQPRRPRQLSRKDMIFLKTPFLGNRAHSMLRSLFRDLNLRLDVAYKSRTLRQVLKTPSDFPCTLRNCPINNKKYAIVLTVCTKVHVTDVEPFTSGVQFDRFTSGPENTRRRPPAPSTNISWNAPHAQGLFSPSSQPTPQLRDSE